MGTLANKILSYNPEIYRPFTDTTVSTSAAKFGTLTADTITLGAATQITYVADGPIGESQDSWNFQKISASADSRITHPQTASVAAVNDKDFSAGLWVKWVEYPSNASNHQIFNCGLVSATGGGFSLSYSGSTASSPRRLVVQTSNGTTSVLTTSTNTIPNDTNWHYIALRRNSGNIEIYFDGVLWITATNGSATAGSGSFIYGGVAANALANFNLRLSHFYLTPFSTINATAISEIWTAGSTSGNINVTITETPATASALMTEPTIVIVANDNVQVTTSFLASVDIPQNIVAGGDKNVNIVVTEVLTASANIVNNVIVSTGTDDEVVAAEMTATAEFLDPILSQQPMIASAIMPGGDASVTPNYFNLVKPLNPYLYIHNGLSSPVNYGTQSGTFVRGTNLSTGVNGGTPMNLIAEGLSWRGSSTNNSNGFFTFETTNFADSFHNVIGTGNFAYEVWVKPNQFPENQAATSNGISFAILNAEKLKIVLEDYYTSTGDFLGTPFPRYISLKINNTLTNQVELTTPIDSSPLSLNNWNHIVVNVYQSGINANQRLVQLWINGQVVINQTIAFTPWVDTTDKVNYVLGSNAVSLTLLSDMFYDELAIYEAPLTNSQIIQHNQFISTQSPNRTMFPESFTANVESGDHNFVVQSNAIITETPATVSALFVMPTVIASKVINVFADPLIASALNTDVTVYWGWTIYPETMIAAAESKEGFFLSDVYYNYVQANIAPYRYVTFDAANTLTDYGTDNDYAVIPTFAGGTIVNPDLGINGKAVKTAGTSYITDGVILKESEWNDDWGTTGNRYHSAFWIQKAADDTSTGLRVIWNLNGHYDNQHIILYQYQNKLTLSFSDGTTNFINQTTTNNINLFDGQRHFIVVDIDHVGVNDTAYLYVDAVLQMSVSLGSYRVETVNGIVSVPPNDEANNHPRLGIGCLITPFGATSLPVIPTNTKLIIDEVYWDKDAINQTMITNLFNAMPDKTNKNIMAESMTASDEFVMPAFSTSSIIAASPLTASVELIEPVTTADREVVYTASAMTATALAGNAVVFEDKIILSDIFVATATFNNAGAVISIPGPTMIASVKLQSSGIYLTRNGSSVRFYPNRVMSPWLAYLRATDVTKILPMREVQ